MKYRNIKTGAIIDVPSEINDSNWELYAPGLIEETKVEAPKEIKQEVVQPVAEKKATKKTTKTATIHPRKKKGE